jgi:hypothetical protein
MKQTAVEWFSESISEILGKIPLTEKQENLCINALNQAKEMFEQQVRNAWIDGKENKEFGFHVSLDAEIYYNKTFKQQEQ